jgi:hypothetical protein
MSQCYTTIAKKWKNRRPTDARDVVKSMTAILCITELTK